MTDTRPPEAPRYLKPLQVLVVVMGVMIILGVVVLSVEIYRRATDPAYAARRARHDAPAIAAPPAAAPRLLPPGATITGMVAVGGRLAVSVREGDGSQVLYWASPEQSGAVEFLRTRPASP